MIRKLTFVCVLAMMNSHSVQAVEVAPRISDREIIEGLADVKATINAVNQVVNAKFDSVNQRFDSVNQRFDSVNQRFNAVNQRFDEVNQRFESVDKRFELMEKQTAARFDAMEKMTNQRFDQMDKQFDKIWNLMLVIIAGIFGLIGFIVWDRKSALKPIEQRLDRIETELHHDLEIQHEQGSRMTRLINALRELAQTDPKVAGVLRHFSLL